MESIIVWIEVIAVIGYAIGKLKNNVGAFLPNASPVDAVQDTKLTFHQIFGNFMVGPRVAQEFRSLT